MDLLQQIVVGVISGASVVVIAAFFARRSLTRILDSRLEVLKNELGVQRTQESTLESQIEFRERQLAEFYGPIHILLKRGRPIYDHWEEGRLEEIALDLESLFVEANNRIADIILTRSHLIRGPEIPAAFINFLTHVAVWDAFLKTKHKGVLLSEEQFPEAYYSDEFEKEIFNTTQSLKRELDRLYQRYGLVEARQA